MAENIVQIKSLPGIKRDGTKFEGDQYVDGQWVRFQRALPRKIGGYRSINKFLRGLVRTLHEYTQDSLTYVHGGSANLLERFFIDGSFNTSVISNRTPSTLVANSANLWQFDVDTALGGGLQLVAQVAPNLNCICNSTGGQIFTGDEFGTGALVEVPAINLPAVYSATGGIVALHPYTVVFGNDGFVMWSVPGDPTDFVGSGAGNAYVTGQKIVRGMALRGGPGNSPSGLLWSADSLLRMSYIGGTATFQFDTLSAQSSILSAQSVIEYDGIFYWIGSDRFLSFNGVVREVPNQLNLNFFFDNLNYAQRQKVFAYKVPRFGEIWWCFPKDDSLEPNHAVIFNVRENTWYDTPLPNGGRGAGLFPAVFPKPLLSGVAPQDAQVTAAVAATAGSGYVVGNVLTVVGGDYSIGAELTVATVNGTGGVLTVSISNAGSYNETPANPVSVTGGAGTLATFTLTFVNPYKFWVHETGVDEVDGLAVNPILSFFETADLSLPVMSQTNKALQVLLMEPDFVQSGPLTVQAMGRANARGPEVNGEIKVIVETPQTPQEQVIYFKEQRRELRFRFASDCVGGDYQMGLVLAHVQPGDGTTIG
jgi:hypothetical protein